MSHCFGSRNYWTRNLSFIQNSILLDIWTGDTWVQTGSTLLRWQSMSKEVSVFVFLVLVFIITLTLNSQWRNIFISSFLWEKKNKENIKVYNIFIINIIQKKAWRIDAIRKVWVRKSSCILSLYLSLPINLYIIAIDIWITNSCSTMDSIGVGGLLWGDITSSY